ncbi:MAG TPA: hypothetical protein VJQ52_06590 [Steroidobacteraceae bacterium]|nr:hypothetical protein [Steroidobacteraceae bacterium]
MPGATDFRIERSSRLVVKQHTHALPLCKGTTHDASCARKGYELTCVRVIIGFNKITMKPTFGAFCTHLYF